MSCLSVDQLSYAWRDVSVVRDLSFRIEVGQFACLLGPSGCGKTTLLRLIAGLETPAAGRITLMEETLNAPGVHVPPERRRIGMVFQEPALFPTKTVAQNITFGLAKAGRDERLQILLDHIGLTDRANAYPHELSGGQQHRVALARALAPSPRLLLLDEPFAHLDPERRTHLRDETKALAQREGVTCLMVTHDAEEAMAVGDVLLLMDEQGRIRQQGTPGEVYRRPTDSYAAKALGEINLLPAQSDGEHLRCALGEWPIVTQAGEWVIGVRPQAITLSETGADNRATITQVRCYGADDALTLKLDTGEAVRVMQRHGHDWAEGQSVSLWVASEQVHLFAADEI